MTVNTKKLMKKIKSMNALFDNDDHHDSHEFLIWLLNTVHEEISPPPQRGSLVSEVFEGDLISRTRCLECENGNEREETFMALSLDIEKGHSLNQCIRQFAHKEWMLNQDKFYCETCCTKQVATRQMMIKRKPAALVVHLKRFKIDPKTLRYQKLAHRIPFPTELRIESALDDSNDILYNLKGIVVHLGQGYAYGHYFALIKSRGRWLRFDDTSVDLVDEKYIKALFGSGHGSSESNWPTAYMLLYDSDLL